MHYRLLIATSAAFLIVAACGGTADETTTTPPPSAAAPSTTTTQTTSTVDSGTATPTTTASPTTTSPPSTTTAVPADVVVSIANGAVTGGAERIKVDQGALVTMEIVSDTDGELHIHGLDVFFDLTTGVNTLSFRPESQGIFEAELEGSGLLLFELQVS